MLAVWVVLKGKILMKKRTKKEFVGYNDYQDRAFGLKWGTAFALSELTQVINSAQQDALRDVKELKQMTRHEIDDVLQRAFLKSIKVSIQCNQRDENGILYDNIEGLFQGMADEDCFYIDDDPVYWEAVRNIKIIK